MNYSSYECKSRIENGKGKDRYWDNKRYYCMGFEKTHYGYNRKNVSQKQCTRISHKYLCGINIKGEKADTAACKYCCDKSAGGVGNYQRNKEKRDGTNGGNTAGKSVKAVDYVYGVGKTYYPYYSYRY